MLKDVLSVVYGLHKYKNQESEFETDHKSYKPDPTCVYFGPWWRWLSQCHMPVASDIRN